MYTLSADEKTALVMIYTHNSLLRGNAVVKESIRVSTWLRTEGAPEYKTTDVDHRCQRD